MTRFPGYLLSVISFGHVWACIRGVIIGYKATNDSVDQIIVGKSSDLSQKSWRDKEARMAELIKVTVSERYDLVLTEAQVNRIRNLVIPSLRRGRHELTRNTVLAGSEAANDFLIAFITKRLNLEKGRDAHRTEWERYSERAAVLAEAAKQPARNSIPCRPVLRNTTDPSLFKQRRSNHGTPSGDRNQVASLNSPYRPTDHRSGLPLACR